jgi:hypothetical protein
VAHCALRDAEAHVAARRLRAITLDEPHGRVRQFFDTSELAAAIALQVVHRANLFLSIPVVNNAFARLAPEGRSVLGEPAVRKRFWMAKRSRALRPSPGSLREAVASRAFRCAPLALLSLVNHCCRG